MTLKLKLIILYLITLVVIKKHLLASFFIIDLMKKVLVIVGPTSVGKTSFGIRCAELFNGEVISKMAKLLV